MPIYEYRCQVCGKRFNQFWRSFSSVDESQVMCPACGSREVTRLISRVRALRSEESRLDELADPSMWGDLDENDPRSMGRMMRKMANELGDEAGDLGPEFEEVVDRLEAGQSFEEIEAEVPSLASDDAPGPDL